MNLVSTRASRVIFERVLPALDLSRPPGWLSCPPVQFSMPTLPTNPTADQKEYVWMALDLDFLSLLK